MVTTARRTVTDAIADGVFSVAEAVRFSAQCKTKLYMAMSEGQLAFFKDGKRRFIAKRDLIAWLATRLKEG